MKLLGLIASALALDYDDLDKGKNKGSKRPAKVETFDCGGVAIADAVTAQTNVVVSGCLDFTSNEVTGEEAVREILKMKKPDDGETAVCVFVCAEGFMEAESERMIDWINEERAKKGKKKKGNKNKNKGNKKKDKKNKKKSKKTRRTRRSARKKEIPVTLPSTSPIWRSKPRVRTAPGSSKAERVRQPPPLTSCAKPSPLKNKSNVYKSSSLNYLYIMNLFNIQRQLNYEKF